MRKVQLKSIDSNKDSMALASIFVNAAVEQNFDLDWVETVLFKALANRCVNFKAIMLEHIEIIPAQTNILK